MGIIRETQRDDDPRSLSDLVDLVEATDIQPPPSSTSATSQPQQATPAEPNAVLPRENPEAAVEPSEVISDVPPTETGGLDPNAYVPPTEPTQEYNNPLNFVPQIPGTNSQPNFNIFPTISDLKNTYTEQGQQMIQEQIGGLPGLPVLTGEVQPSLYETGLIRNDLIEKTRQLYNVLPQSIPEQVKKEVIIESITPRRRQSKLDEPNMNSNRRIANSPGVVGWLKKTGANSLNWVGDQFSTEEFAPLAGFRQVIKDIQEDPMKHGWKLPLIGVLGVSGADFKEFGAGWLGATLYGLSLPQNIVAGGLTDIYNAVSGNENPESKDANVVQSLQGEDFSFTNLNSAERPLAVVGSKDNPERFEDLQDRSWLWRGGLMNGFGIPGTNREIPGILDITENIVSVFQSEEDKGKIPEWTPDRTVQTVEFITGLGMDLITDPTTYIGVGLVDKAADLFRLSQKGDDALDAVRLLPGDVNVPVKALPPANTTDDIIDVVAREVDEVTDEIIDNIPPNRPQLTPENYDSALDDVLDNPNALVGEVEEIVGSYIEPPQLSVIDNVIKESLPQLPAPNQLLLPGTTTVDNYVDEMIEGLNKVTPNDLLNLPSDDVSSIVPMLRRSNSELSSIIGLDSPLSTRRLQYAAKTSDLVNYVNTNSLPTPRLNVDNRTTQILNTVADILIDNPNTVDDVFTYQRRLLPSVITSRTDEGIRLTAKYLRDDQVFESISSEAGKLEALYKTQKAEVIRNVERLHNTPDITRKLTDEKIATPLEYVRPDAPDFYTNHPSLSSITPDESELAKVINGQTLYHGTKTIIEEGFDTIDPIVGAARSEIGTVIHTTSDEVVGSLYATANPGKNLTPNVRKSAIDATTGMPNEFKTRKFVEDGIVYKVQPNVVRPLDVTKPIAPEYLTNINESLKQMKDLSPRIRTRIYNRALKEGKTTSTEELFKIIDDVLLDEFSSVPEEIVSKIQRNVTATLRDAGRYDALVKQQGDYYQVGFTGIPNTMTATEMVNRIPVEDFVNDIPTQPLQKQMYARYKADQLTASLYPDSKFARTQALDSLVDYQVQEMTLTGERALRANQMAQEIGENLVKQEEVLRKMSESEALEKAARTREVVEKQNTRKIQSYNKPETGIC